MTDFPYPMFDAPVQVEPVRISGRNLPRKNYSDGAEFLATSNTDLATPNCRS